MQKFDIESCHGLITTTNYDVIIDCTFNEFVQNNIVQYSAAAPPDYRTSFSGSGLPYHNKDQAYYKTPNQGTVKLNNNQCKIKILKPNSYYADFNNLELPYINLMYNNKVIKLNLYNEKIAYRSLDHPKIRYHMKEHFYQNPLPIQTQEKILFNSQYTLQESNNFWGGKPPL